MPPFKRQAIWSQELGATPIFSDAKDLVDVMRTLLLMCKGKEWDYDLYIRNSHHKTKLDQVQDELAHFFHKVGIQKFRKEYQVELNNSHNNTEGLPKSVWAFTASLALDESLQQSNGWFKLFSKRALHAKKQAIQPDDVIFIAQPPLTQLFKKGELNSNPSNLDHRIQKRLPKNVGLASVLASQFEIEPIFDELIADQVDQLIGSEIPLAVGVPNGSVKELRLECQEGQWKDVGPKDHENQTHRIKKLIEAAANHNSSVLVLPELCIEESMLNVIESAAREAALSGQLRLVVAGSYHARLDEQFVANRLTAFFPQIGQRIEHDKFSPFQGMVGSQKCEEALKPSHTPRLRIVMGKKWSLTFLVCKDFLDQKVEMALRELGVRIVLVPALSLKLDPFQGIQTILALRNQAISLVANAPFDSEQTLAILGVPRAKQHSFICRLGSQGTTNSTIGPCSFQPAVPLDNCRAPGLCLLYPLENTAQWLGQD